MQKYDRRRILGSRLAIEELSSSYIGVMISCHERVLSVQLISTDLHQMADTATSRPRMWRHHQKFRLMVLILSTYIS